MKILCIHPSCELYGSDRSFGNALQALSGIPGLSLRVVLPCRGPLLSLPALSGIPVTIRAMWVLRRRGLLRGFTLGLWGNIGLLRQAWKDLRASDCAYVNTIVPFDFIVMARLVRIPVAIHVREIPMGMEMRLFRAALLWSKATLIFNSNATRAAFHLPPAVRSHVVYNGQALPAGAEAPVWNGERPLRLLTIGRINGWKGQEVLISAIGQLSPAERRRFAVRIVGGTFGNQNEFRDRLVALIAELGLGETVRLDPFEDDPSASYRAADIVVVPSRLPEPFGRVAIEAMAFARPVIASAHGGLTEIVADGTTGRLFKPADARDLADTLREFLKDPALLSAMGAAGLRRFRDMFTTEATNAALADVLRRELAPEAPALPPAVQPEASL